MAEKKAPVAAAKAEEKKTSTEAVKDRGTEKNSCCKRKREGSRNRSQG